MAKKDRTEDLVKDLIHEEDWKRMNATAELLKRGPEAVSHLIAEGLSAGNPALRVETAKMLGRIKDRTAGGALVESLKDPDSQVRQAAAEAIGHVADAPALRALVQLLEDEVTRDVAAEVLGRLKDPAAMEPLAGMMTSPDPTARRLAAEALEQLADPRSVDAWIQAMVYPDLLEIASRSLKRISDLQQRIADTLDSLRDIEDAVALEEARIGVSMDLIALGRPAVTELLEALDDGLWVVREAAAQALGIIGDPRAVEPLLQKAKTDRDRGVRESCIKALGEFGDARSIDVLVEAVQDRTTRLAATEAMSKIKDITVLLPHAKLIQTMKADRDGLVSYLGGLMLDKLEKLTGAVQKEEEDPWGEDAPEAKQAMGGKAKDE
jgi:HEAT repeat protein